MTDQAGAKRLKAVEGAVERSAELYERYTAYSVDGATFVLDAPEQVPAIWGDGENVAWAAGEPLMIVGPQGVGKTTLAQRLAVVRAGIRKRELLGMPVDGEPDRVLYIAADRPRQIARSLRRMVTESDRTGLQTALVVWPGPLPFDLGNSQPGQLLELVDAIPEVGTVVIDALKDVAVGLADDQIGARISQELGRLIAAGYELVVVHHQRKATNDNKRPRSLDDVYGSTLLTGGFGSVLMLWGKAGDPIVDLRHLKQPAGEIGPLTLIHDHGRGEIQLHEPEDLLSLVNGALNGGLTVRDAAASLFSSGDPDRNEIEKARRRLEAVVGAGHAVRIDGPPVRYRPVEKGSA